MSSPLVLQRPSSIKPNRVAIFIDAANLFYAAGHLGIHIDYRKLKNYLTGRHCLTNAYFYTGVDSANLQQQSFLSCLRHIGYQVIAKELVKRADGSVKANLDVKIALDMRKLANSYDTAILVSGDGDLEWVVEEVQDQGKRVEVIGLGSMTSFALRQVSDRYIDLADICSKICSV